MKKSILIALSMCTMLVASCTKEVENPPMKEFVDVTFDLGAENVIASRAISDGTGADLLMYGVFSDDNELIIPKAVKNGVSNLTSSSGYSMTISLAKGQTYQVVFWAQDSDCDAYTVSDDMKVTIDYNGINNDESRAAFFAVTEKFKVGSSTTVSVVLKRPFAQVNVGAYPFDLELVEDMGVEIRKSSATVSGVANQLNLLDGEVSGDVDVTYTLNACPSEKLLVDVDMNSVQESYEWLSMSYILAGAKTTHAMSFSFSDDNDSNVITFDEGLEFVPIQRNFRTNIVGQILSGTTSFNIKIDPIYEGETINSAGLYYNFSEDTTIENKVFAFNTTDGATFTSENNNLITMKNVTFSGKIEQIAMGEYRDKGNYVEFRNDMTNVVAENMVVTHPTGIANVEPVDYMSPLFFLRGVTTLTDCRFTGTTSVAPEKIDYNGDYHQVLPYDCGVPNGCEATFNNCIVDRLYAWSHSQITLKDTKMKYIRCSTHHNSEPKAHLTIDSGSVVDEIFVSSTSLAKFATIDGKKTLTTEKWAPSLIIKAGATVKRLDMNNRPSLDKNGNLSVIIEAGANIGEIVNAVDVIPNAPTVTEP